jgi:hypothetical protein
MLDGRAGSPGRPASARGTRVAALAALIALAFLVAGLALAARWHWAAVPDGRQLRPRPDALEYAAAAQAIAAEGRYLLQVGPYRVRPRYPPGWPLLLAGAVRLGVPGEELWRVGGLFGAGLACLLALAAAGAVWRLRAAEGRRAAAGALAAGALAGMGWALAPLAVAVGRVALADEPAAFVAALMGVATYAGFMRPAPAAAALGGLAFGLLAAMRPASAALFAPAVLIFALYGWRARGVPGKPGAGGVAARPAVGGSGAANGKSGLTATGDSSATGGSSAANGFGTAVDSGAASDPADPGEPGASGGRRARRREPWRWAAPWAAGAAVVPLLIALLLSRSQLPPWRWSGYGFWAPRWYTDAGATFNLRYALRGNDDFTRGADDRPIPNLRFYAQVLLGLPGLESASYLGLYWPAAGWLAGWLTLWRGRRRHPAAATALPAAAAALLGHLVFYSLYFFPDARFLLALMALPLLGAAVACGLGISAPATAPATDPGRAPGARQRWRRRTRPASWLAAAALAGAGLAGFLAFRAQPAAARFPDRDVRAAFAAWQRLPEQERARTPLPFDPLEAQALGLLPPSVARGIRVWGELPPTVHVKRLRALGIVPAGF